MLQQLDYVDPLKACKFYNALKPAYQAEVINLLFNHRGYVPTPFEKSFDHCFADGHEYLNEAFNCSLFTHAQTGNGLFVVMRLIGSLSALAQNELFETWNAIDPISSSMYLKQYHYSFEVVSTFPENVLYPVICEMPTAMKEGLGNLLPPVQSERLKHLFNHRIKRIRMATMARADEDAIVRMVFTNSLIKAHEQERIWLPGFGDRIQMFYYHSTMPEEWVNQYKSLAKGLLPYKDEVINWFRNEMPQETIAITLYYADPLVRERILKGTTPQYRLNISEYGNQILSGGLTQDDVLQGIYNLKGTLVNHPTA